MNVRTACLSHSPWQRCVRAGGGALLALLLALAPLASWPVKPGEAAANDPTTGTWHATGSLGTGRGMHTATLLPNGKVLVAGGGESVGASASAELYDPATGTWHATGSLGTARLGHTATLLPNGKVLVAGGWGGYDLL